MPRTARASTREHRPHHRSRPARRARTRGPNMPRPGITLRQARAVTLMPTAPSACAPRTPSHVGTTWKSTRRAGQATSTTKSPHELLRPRPHRQHVLAPQSPVVASRLARQAAVNGHPLRPRRTGGLGDRRNQLCSTTQWSLHGWMWISLRPHSSQHSAVAEPANSPVWLKRCLRQASGLAASLMNPPLG